MNKFSEENCLPHLSSFPSIHLPLTSSISSSPCSLFLLSFLFFPLLSSYPSSFSLIATYNLYPYLQLLYILYLYPHANITTFIFFNYYIYKIKLILFFFELK